LTVRPGQAGCPAFQGPMRDLSGPADGPLNGPLNSPLNRPLNGPDTEIKTGTAV